MEKVDRYSKTSSCSQVETISVLYVAMHLLALGRAADPLRGVEAPESALPKGNALRIAIIGSGVAGLTAAHLLHGRHDVHLFEADDRPGGHATPAGGAARGTVDVDTGFLVYNERTYPHSPGCWPGSAWRPTRAR